MSQQQVPVSVSPLLRRMLDDMAMREETQRNYIMFVRTFASFLGRSPDTATAEDVRPFPGASSRERRAAPFACFPTMLRTAEILAGSAHRQLFGLGVALPVHRDAGPAGPVAAARPGPPGSQASDRVERRRSRAAARGGARTETQGCARDRLRCRAARLRGGRPQDRRYRQHAHADPGRTGEGSQGPQRDAVAPTAGTAQAGAAAPQRWAATSRPAKAAATSASPTTAAATGTAPSARARRRATGSQRERPTCSPSAIPRRLHGTVSRRMGRLGPPYSARPSSRR